MTDAEEYWERQDEYEARVAFERDGYGVPYTPAIRKAYEEFVRSERLHRDVGASLTRALAHELYKRDRPRATGGVIGDPVKMARSIYVCDFPPFQNAVLRAGEHVVSASDTEPPGDKPYSTWRLKD